MRKSWLVARTLSGSVVLLIAVAVLVWLPASGSAGRARVSNLDISPIHADFDGDLKQTTYSLPTVSDPNATYQWTLIITAPVGQVDPNKGVDLGCNNHGVLIGADKTFVWHHGNKGDPLFDDGCDHDLQGQWGHQGLITVTVSDSAGDHCAATYKGTFSTDANATLGQNAASDRVCTNVPPPAPPPPPPPPPPPQPQLRCRCIRLSASIVPSSVKIEDKYNKVNGVADDEAELRFSLRWRMRCARGTSGKCASELLIFMPTGDAPLKEVKLWHSRTCRGRCSGRPNVGSIRVSVDYENFSPIQRQGRRIPVVIHPICGNVEADSDLWIMFKDTGSVDLKKSKLG
jgi:hypothetical protein